MWEAHGTGCEPASAPRHGAGVLAASPPQGALSFTGSRLTFLPGCLGDNRWGTHQGRALQKEGPPTRLDHPQMRLPLAQVLSPPTCLDGSLTAHPEKGNKV